MMAILTNAHRCVITAATVTRKLMSGLAVAFLVLGLATSAQAQQSSGSIKGTVTGASSGTVVQVTDTARGITKSESTDSRGAFRFDGLTPGKYEVSVLSGGQVVDSEVVTVSIGGTTGIKMATTAEAIEEIVTTGKRMAAIDTSIAESGLVISAETLLEMPVQRDLSSVAMLAPGVNRGDYRFGSVNGGGDGGGGIISFGGASVAENTAFINGLNTTNFRNGLGFSQVPFEFYETVQVKTGGYSAKFGRSLGGVMNARTKSGSNEWNYGFNAYYEKQLNESPETYLAANEQDEQDATTFDVFVSGPIIKDHLFFYALYSDADTSKDYAHQTSTQGFNYEVNEGFWGAKIDWYVTDNHHLELTGFTDERTGEEAVYDFDSSTGEWGALIGTTFYDEGGDNWIATYTGDITNNFQIALSYGENDYSRTSLPDTAENPVLREYDVDSNIIALGNWTLFNLELGGDNREMTRIDLNWIVGNHSISGGLDQEVNTSDSATINSGSNYWLTDPLNVTWNCSALECPQGATARQRNYNVAGSFETTSEAFYIQDVWEVNDSLTLELGLRSESFENLNGEGEVFVKVDDQIAPRLAAVWDPTGEGRQKIFANWGLYYLPIAQNTNIRMSANETYIQDYYDWGGMYDANDIPIGLGPQYDQDLFGDGTVPDTRSTTDRNIEPMYQSEAILGYQYITDSGVELGIKGIYRQLETTIEDVAIDAAVIDFYDGSWDTSMNAGDVFDPMNPLTTGCGGTTASPPNTRDCNATDYFGGFHQYVLTNPGIAMDVYIPEQDEQIVLTAEQLNYPKAERQYAAMELSYDRPFDGRWSMNVNYLWSHSWGNHEGYVKSDNAQDDAGITTNFDQPGLTDFSYGDLPNDRRHSIKIFGTYQLDNGLRFGSTLLWQSGRPMSCFGLHPTDVFAEAYDATSHFCQGVGVKRGTAGRTPDILNIDFTAQYAMDMGNANVLFALDIYNVFDSANATHLNEFGDTAGGTVNPNHGLVRQYQSPRSMRLSARVRF